MAKMSRAELKEKAQEEIMVGIADVLGYTQERMDGRGDWVGEENAEAFREIIRREADRVAKLFGYEKAWSN